MIGDHTGSIGAAALARLLGNSTTQTVGQTRYRFVWLDGCETANGIWPSAFALGKQENRPLDSYAARPGAFCGFTREISIHASNPDGSGLVNQKGAFYRLEFRLNWHFYDKTVKKAFEDARDLSGWTGGDNLKIYGYWGLLASEFNRKSDWP